jgi:hypothetical protein
LPARMGQMVRREGTEQEFARANALAVPRYAFLAGESPAPVVAGEPGSRLPCSAEEILPTKRSVKSPRQEGSNEAGRNQMKAVQASSDYQPKGDWERGGEIPRAAPNGAACRAGHFAAKADAQRPASPDGSLGLPGVLAAACFDREARNARDPSGQPTLGKDRPYKARAESGRSRAGVRGVRSTDEGGDKPLEGRSPALVGRALWVSARAWA